MHDFQDIRHNVPSEYGTLHGNTISGCHLLNLVVYGELWYNVTPSVVNLIINKIVARFAFVYMHYSQYMLISNSYILMEVYLLVHIYRFRKAIIHPKNSLLGMV